MIDIILDLVVKTLRKSTSLKNPGKDHQYVHFIVGFFLSFPFIYLYSFALIEAKYSVFLNLQPFRIGRPLAFSEKFLFAIVFTFELFFLLLGVSAILWWIYKKFLPNIRQRVSWLIPCTVIFIYFVLVTAQFQVLRYFKDGLNMVLVRQLGGGDIWSALRYAVSELAQLVPLITAGLIAVGALTFLLMHFGSRITSFFGNIGWIGSWLTLKRLLLVNLLLFIISFAISLYLPVLNKTLGYSLAHHAYAIPWKYITDFDFDGYGLVLRPVDHAPLDAKRHPYALEITANGIDENGVGGDLQEIIWHKSPQAWVEEHLSKQNVLLIVLESARADLYDARYENEWVMPTLRSLPGKNLSVVSHTAFTAPAIISIFNGVHSSLESGPSLIDRFNKMGYRTGVFSAQNEGFGKQDSATGMRRAERFFDSRSVSSDERMYLSNSSIASAIPAKKVLAQFESWLRADSHRPFFGYINLQELHFPYSHANIEKPLLDTPIPRYAINEEKTDWLRNTYYNAARAIDDSLAYLINLLKKTGQFESTIILVVGDHGEELFDFGSLGHGTDINFEQNAPLAKLINAAWTPDKNIPIGLSEIPILVQNALIRDEHERIPMQGSVLAFSGVRKPLQIGLFTKDGLIKYDFRKDIWTRQPAYGLEEIPSSPDWQLIHLWESLVLSTGKSKIKDP